MAFPLVTIITPSYNQAEYLAVTIQSVLAQDYPNLEYFIIDGGSTDGSLDIIQNYADQLTGWISEPDRGQADAINKGFRQAHGDVVAWLNSDDLYLPGAIHEAVKALQTDPHLGMVFGDAITIDPQGHPLNKLAFGNWDLSDLMRFRIICQPAVFIRRSFLERSGFLSQDFHFMLDHHLWLRIASQAPIKHIEKIWAAARYHSMAKNVAQAPRFADETYRTVNWLRTDSEFAARFETDRRRILGGANRLAARYLLDGGLPGPALQAYIKALVYWPSYALKHWGRIMFAMVNLLGIGNINALSRRQTLLLDDENLQNWPGINLA